MVVKYLWSLFLPLLYISLVLHTTQGKPPDVAPTPTVTANATSRTSTPTPAPTPSPSPVPPTPEPTAVPTVVVTLAPPPPPPPPPVHVPATDIEALGCKYFGSACGQAIRIMYCESGGVPTKVSPNGLYYGLFQIWNGHFPADWPWYEPEPNISLAYNFYSKRGWRDWPVCRYY